MPKTRIALIILLCFCVIAISACAKREIQNIGSSGENIICFGDSITFGYGVKPGEDYPSVLSKMVKMPVINAGVDGDTSISAFKRIEKDVLDRKPFLVLIEFCGNDFLKDIPQESTINNVRSMILRAQGQGAITVIVDISAGFFLRDYRMKFSRLAKETGSIFVPAVLSGIITNPAMKSDFMHPNQEGYKIIAQRIHCAISPYLKSE
ncbi:MAG: GDSL-type esterase/lipase family protein [Candidatus Omnitrophota bacterium]|jgi:lysophospholipase L1-like esterase